MAHSVSVSLSPAGAPTTFIPTDFLYDLLDYLAQQTLDFRCAYSEAGVTLTFPSLKLPEAQRALQNWERILPCTGHCPSTHA